MAKKQLKKQQQLKSKQINISNRSDWAEIIKSIEKNEIPITVLQSVKLNLTDGTDVDIDILELLQEGMDPEEIEFKLNNHLQKLDHIIEDMDFFINIDLVMDTIQPMTDKILKNL